MVAKKYFDAIIEILKSFEVDADKFDNKGNASAGTRVRNHLSDIAKLCKEGRAAVQAQKVKK